MSLLNRNLYSKMTGQMACVTVVVTGEVVVLLFGVCHGNLKILETVLIIFFLLNFIYVAFYAHLIKIQKNVAVQQWD